MVIIDGLIDLVVDYNLILFVANMLEDAVVVATFSFAHEIFAVLHCSKQNAKSRAQVREGLGYNKKYDEGCGCRLLVSIGHVGSRVPVVLFGLHALHLARRSER